MTSAKTRIHALLFDLNAELAGDLVRPLESLCSRIESLAPQNDKSKLEKVADSSAQVIFCSANTRVVADLRNAKPEATIVVVSRFPEVSTWLDSIEAGATDYCAAPFESQQLRWILDSSIRSAQMAA